MARTLEFYLFPDALGLDITGPLEVFSTATELLRRRGQPDAGYRPVFSADAPGRVRVSSGLVLFAEVAVGQGDVPDTFMVPGGPGVDALIRSEGILSSVRAATTRARRVVSVCNGAFILAACGLLKGRRATTHWCLADEMARRYPDVAVTPDAIFLKDGHIATSAGVTAGIDLALALVEDDHGASLAMDVARMLVLYLRRPGGQPQFSAPMESRQRAGKRFNKLYDWMVENLDRSISVEQLAERAGMSPRNFSRVFSSETGMAPGKFLETLRLDHARELLESGDDSSEMVAQASGFGREERLRRVFIRRLGITPGQYRNHFAKSNAPLRA